MRVLNSPNFPIILASCSFLVYLTTISPTVNFIDSGELITVSCTLGIAHPTGYPLYTLLGRLFSLIPMQTPACRVNLLSAVFGAAAVFFLSLTAMKLSRDRSGSGDCVAAFLTASFLSLSKTFWDVSTQAEVYSLTIFLYSLLIYLLLVEWKQREGRRLLLFAFLFGLSFGNHMMIVLLLPSVLFAAVMTRSRSFWKRPECVACALLFFALGLSVYLYLPVRSALKPVLDWGNPTTLDRFIAHVSGWQYRVWMFTEGTGAFLVNLRAYFPRLISEFTPAGVVVAALGLIGMLTRRTEAFFFLVLLTAAGLFYALNYDIPDIEPYFLPTYASLSLMAGIGVPILLDTLLTAGRARARKYIIVLLLLAAAGSMAGNYRLVDKSRNHLAYYYGFNFLNSLEGSALAVTKSWDIYSPIIYLQLIEGIRPDVVLIDYELMRRSWYVNGLLERPVRHSEKTRKALREFSRGVRPFERGESFDAAHLEKLFRRMWNAILEDGLERGEVYLDFLDEEHLMPEYLRIPHLMTYRLSRAAEIDMPGYETLILEGVIDTAVPKDERATSLLDRYWIVAVNRGVFLAGQSRYQDAVDSFEFALRLAPHNITALRGLGFCFISLGKYREAEGVIEKVLELNPGDAWATEAKNSLK